MEVYLLLIVQQVEIPYLLKTQIFATLPLLVLCIFLEDTVQLHLFLFILEW